MKKTSIFFFAALLLFGCSTNDQTTDSAEVVTDDTETMATDDAMATTGTQDIVTLASETPSLSTLVQAIQAADLGSTLQGPGPFTVFAPTNEAFAALPAGTLENLLKPENKQQLVDILTYHVTSGNVMAGDLSNDMNVTTVNGKDVKVMLNGGNVMINEAGVTTPDVKASNGVVHIIDKVMLPPSM